MLKHTKMSRKGKEQKENNDTKTTEENLPFNEIEFLGKEFKVVTEIGRGSYGKVISVQADDGEELAVKVVCPPRLSEQELIVWPNLKHKNILPLMRATTKDCFYIFIMPIYECTLDKMIKKSFFRKDPTSFDVIKEWLHHIASGLKYLHDKELCHLDLKQNNILISKRFRAVISDFGYLNTTKTPIRSIPLHSYHAPEIWDFSTNEKKKVFGGPIDIWDFGILAVRCFNGFKKRPRNESDELVIKKGNYPAVNNLLKLPAFQESLRKNIPNAVVSEKDCVLALNFFRGLLRFTPSKRKTVYQIFQHRFLPQSTDKELFEVDSVWNSDDAETKARRVVQEEIKSKVTYDKVVEVDPVLNNDDEETKTRENEQEEIKSEAIHNEVSEADQVLKKNDIEAKAPEILQEHIKSKVTDNNLSDVDPASNNEDMKTKQPENVQEKMKSIAAINDLPEDDNDAETKANEIVQKKVKYEEKSIRKSPLRRLRGWFRKQTSKIKSCFCCCC